SSDCSSTPSAATDCRGKVHEGHRFSVGYQCENCRITSIKTDAETGYSRDGKPSALRGSSRPGTAISDGDWVCRAVGDSELPVNETYGTSWSSLPYCRGPFFEATASSTPACSRFLGAFLCQVRPLACAAQVRLFRRQC